MKTYKSKVDSRIVLIVVVVMVVSTVPCMFVPGAVWPVLAVDMVVGLRSEEHTSELQSH